MNCVRRLSVVVVCTLLALSCGRKGTMPSSGINPLDGGALDNAVFEMTFDVGFVGAEETPIVEDAAAYEPDGDLSPVDGPVGVSGETGAVSDDAGIADTATRCEPTTCAKLGANCGDYRDTCGGVLHCGICAQGQICSVDKKSCVLQTALCSSSDSCGFVSDACGNSYACGKTCGAGFKCQSNQCTACKPVSCEGRCGSFPDGCGSKTTCPSCPSGQVCDALTFTCGVCQKVKCSDYPASTCGTLSDHCGGTLNCPCPTATTPPPACVIAGVECGKFTDHCAAGVSHDCGSCTAGKVCNNNICVSCSPLTCASVGKNCGTIDDGCGGKLACGDCQTNEICSSNVCKACSPKTCTSEGKNCGSLDDGCGNKVPCGDCQTNEICTSNVCKTCSPKTCTSEGKNCGSLDDGCGKKLECGTCQTNEICSSNLCKTCSPKTCASAERTCGKLDDGCGHTLTCPGCAAGEVCLSNGTCCRALTCLEIEVSGTIPDGCGGFLTCKR